MALLTLLICVRLLPESARWLMTQGRKEEAQKELMRVARVNGRKIPEHLLTNVSSMRHDKFLTITHVFSKVVIISFVQLEMEALLKKESMLDIFRIPYLRKQTFILGFIWCVFQ